MKAYLLAHWQTFVVGAMILTTSMLYGCTFLRDRPAAARLAVSYAVGKYIESADRPAERAQRVRDVALKVAQYIDASDDVLVEDLRAVAVANLPPTLGAADRTLAIALIDAVTEELKARIKTGALPEDIRMNARSVVQWVAAAASAYLPG